jgi:hypothetical protein
VLRFAEQMLVAAVPGLPQQVLAVALLVETLVAQVAAKKEKKIVDSFSLFFLAKEKIFELNVIGLNIRREE